MHQKLPLLAILNKAQGGEIGMLSDKKENWNTSMKECVNYVSVFACCFEYFSNFNCNIGIIFHDSHKINRNNSIEYESEIYECPYFYKWLDFWVKDTISAKSPCNTHSIKALYMTIINFRSATRDYHPFPFKTMLSRRDTSMRVICR